MVRVAEKGGADTKDSLWIRPYHRLQSRNSFIDSTEALNTQNKIIVPYCV